MPKQPPYEPVQPVDDLAARADRARIYMERMAHSANRGLLASETLVGLQRPSQGLPDGVPAMVLRKNSNGAWYAAEWSDPDVTVTERNTTVTPERNAEPEIVTAVTPTVTERNAPETMTNAERQKRHRDRKRAERERARERMGDAE